MPVIENPKKAVSLQVLRENAIKMQKDIQNRYATDQKMGADKVTFFTENGFKDILLSDKNPTVVDQMRQELRDLPSKI